MNPKVFLERKITVGDTVFYNKNKFIVDNLDKNTLKSTQTLNLCILNKKQFRTIKVDPFLVHQYPGESTKQKLTHAFGYFPDLDRTNFGLEYEKTLSKMMNKNYSELSKTLSEASLASLANEKHNLLITVRAGINETCDETFFEYAYRHEVFAYCDTCMDYWFSKHEKNPQIMELLSLVTQPPMHSIITRPALCMFDRKYVRSNFYEFEYVQKTIDTNKTLVQLEEPAAAREITQDEFFDIQAGDPICMQMDLYDVCFLNTKYMTNSHFLGFLNDGQHRARHETIADILPFESDRQTCYGMHFVSKELNETEEQLAPIKLWNFRRFQTYILNDLVMSDLITYNGDTDDITNTFAYCSNPVKNLSSLQFHYTFDEVNDDVTTVWTGRFHLESDKKNDEPMCMTFTLKRGNKVTHSFQFYILLFVTNFEHQPLRLINPSLDRHYENDTERHVKRGVLVEKYLTHDTENGFMVKIKPDCGGEAVVTSTNPTALNTPNPRNAKQRRKFHKCLSDVGTTIQFPEKSYALARIDIGTFVIPTTNYMQNALRLSNGKIPKTCKLLNELSFKKKNADGTSESFLSFFYSQIKQIKEIIPKENIVQCIQEQKADANVTIEYLTKLIANDKLLEFHDALKTIPFQEKNKYIAQFRNMSFKYPSNTIIMCAINRNTCLKLLNASSMLHDWSAFLLDGAAMPTDNSAFKIHIDDLKITPFIRTKMLEKIGHGEFYINALVLAILLKKVEVLPLHVVEYCKCITVTDCNFFPIHFVVHFCDSAMHRYKYTKMLIQQSNYEDAEFTTNAFHRINKTWNPHQSDSHALLYALTEWPFDSLYQIMFLMCFAIDKPLEIYNGRDWFIQHDHARKLFCHIPGFCVVEQKMKAYGYPEPKSVYIESWSRGYKWLTKIGLTESDALVATRKTMLPNNFDTHCFSTEMQNDIQILCDRHCSLYLEQHTLFKKYKNSIEENDDEFIFENIFCSDFDIHNRHIYVDQNTLLSTEKSMYTFLLTNPKLWQENTHLGRFTLGKISEWYLKSCPKFTDIYEKNDSYFVSLESVYLYMRLSLFARYIKTNINHKDVLVSESVVLCRSGCNEKQLKFIHSLLLHLRSYLTEFNCSDVNQMFSADLNTHVLYNYISSKYKVNHWRYPVAFHQIDTVYRADSVAYLANGPGSTSERLQRIIAHMELYMAGCTWLDVRSTFAAVITKDDLNNQHLRYSLLLKSIKVFLMEVAWALHRLEKLARGVDGSKVILDILNDEQWNDTYIKDIIEGSIPILTDTPHLVSYISILFGDLNPSLITNGNLWIQGLIANGEVHDEMHKLLSSRAIQSSVIFTNTIVFINKYILNLGIEHTLFNAAIRKHNRSPDRLTNYVFMPSILMRQLVQFEAGDKITPMLDDLMSLFILQVYHDVEIRKLHNGQFMNFLHTIAIKKWVFKKTKNKQKLLFNNIIGTLISSNLSKSALIFVKTLEMHMDYSFLNQIDEHIFKINKNQYIQPNAYMEYFQLNYKNTRTLIQQASQYDDENYYILIVKLHLNGMINWSDFDKIANSKRASFTETNFNSFNMVHKRHQKVLQYLEKANTVYLFDKDDRYSVSYFVQQGINPFLFDFMKCSTSDVEWIEQLLNTKMTIDAWPYNMYFSNIHSKETPRYAEKYAFANYASQMSIDNFFTMNEGLTTIQDYRNITFAESKIWTTTQTGEATNITISGKYVLEASTFFGYTVLAMYQQTEALTFKRVMDFVRLIQKASKQSLADIIFFQHGCIKSQIQHELDDTYDIVHTKVNVLTLLELFCVDFTPSDFEILIETLDLSSVNINFIAQAMKCSLYFSDNLPLFKKYFELVLLYCSKQQDIFNTLVIAMQTNYRIVSKQIYYFNIDMLTFACQFGRIKHLQYFMEQQARPSFNFKIQNLEERLIKQQQKTDIGTNINLNLSGAHIYYLHASKSPIEHLLYISALHGNVKCFATIWDLLKERNSMSIENVNSIIELLLNVVKFDVVHIWEARNLLARRRIILQIITERLTCHFFNIPYTRYLKLGFNSDVMLKPSHYINALRPHLLTNRKFMRSELQVLGEHIYECMRLIESHTGKQFNFTLNEVVNLALMYSAELTKLVMKRFISNHENNISSMGTFSKSSIIRFLRKKENYGENVDKIQIANYTILYYVFLMEHNNPMISIEEIKENGYLQLLFDLTVDLHVKKDREVFQNFLAEHFKAGHRPKLKKWIATFKKKKRKRDDEDKSASV